MNEWPIGIGAQKILPRIQLFDEQDTRSFIWNKIPNIIS